MRTLATQMRLRRLIRVHTDYVERLAAAPADGELARSARARLLGLSQDVRGAWRADLTGAGGAPGAAVLDRHVERTLRLLESVLAELMAAVDAQPPRSPRPATAIEVPGAD